VLTRKYILSNLWHTVVVDHVVDTHISNLRRKLPREVSDKIQNVPGQGFRYFE
jgi:DNA-binding response OmpR family regulator